MVEAVKKFKPVKVEWSKETTLKVGADAIFSVSNICRFLSRSVPDLGLYGTNILERTEASEHTIASYIILFVCRRGTFEIAILV